MSDDYEYSEIVSRILSRITACEDKKAERISPAVLYELVCSESNDINCYPGSLNDKCCQEAYFISLLSKRYTEGEGHLSFRKALELFFQHMLGKCKGYTKVAILILTLQSSPRLAARDECMPCRGGYKGERSVPLIHIGRCVTM